MEKEYDLVHGMKGTCVGYGDLQQ